MRREALAALTVAAALGAGLQGCGSKPAIAGDRIGGDTLTIYSSGPMHGPSSASAESVLRGEQLALAQIGGRIGKYRIVLRPLDDSIAQRGTWDPGQTTVNARLAVKDPSTIAYLGDLNSGASAVSLPVLNRAGIPQISPTSAAVGLTSAAAGAAPGEPDKYYPTGTRSFARVVPSDAVQASVQVALQKAAGCTKTFVLDDGEVDGEALATSFQLTARARGLDVVGVQSFEPNAPDYKQLALSVAQSGADCVLISAITDTGAVEVTRDVAAALPSAKIFGSDGLAQTSYTSALPALLDSRILLTAPPPGQPPDARAFYAAYGQSFGAGEPDAIYGYEAMSLMLNAISRATHAGKHAARRSQVLSAIFKTRARGSVLGTYSIEPTGDTTIRRFGAYKISLGRLRFWKDVAG